MTQSTLSFPAPRNASAKILHGLEIWKDIKDFPGYQVSSLARIRSIARLVRRVNYSGRITTYTVNEKILSQVICKAGYFVLNLNYQRKATLCYVHRLFAQHFIPNPLNLPYINHKDGNKLNNSIDNLEWCTAKENSWHSLNILGNKPTNHQKGKDHYYSKRCLLIHPDNTEEFFNCIEDVVRKYKLSSGNLGSILSGKRKHTKGFKIKYA